MEKNTALLQNNLAVLNDNRPLSEKLEYLHQVIKGRYDFIERLAIAVYEPKTDLLKTFIHSSGKANPLNHYHAKLSDSRSLQAVMECGTPRVVNDLSIFDTNDKPHSDRIRAQGYRSSYTLPMFNKNDFFGFIFFNAKMTDVFTTPVIHDLNVFAHLMSLTVVSELQQLRTLEAAIRTARDLTHHRDAETGGHLERMSRYARMIATEVADIHGFNDEYIEQIFLFSPLHDIGKIAIPDRILLKPGRLDEEEFEIMKSHTTKGREIIKMMLSHFDMNDLYNGSMLLNIAQYHHEAINGLGYPVGLQGEEIPIEARIIAVADIFDALTSPRPYKEAWDNDTALAMLQEMSGITLDPNCVNAMLNNIGQIEDIQQQFQEDIYA